MDDLFVSIETVIRESQGVRRKGYTTSQSAWSIASNKLNIAPPIQKNEKPIPFGNKFSLIQRIF